MSIGIPGASRQADTSGVFSPTWDAVDGPIAPPGGDGNLCGKPQSLDGRLPRVRNQEWTHAAAESRARPKAAQQGLSHAPGAKRAQMHVTPRYSSLRTRLHGEMRTSCRPRFAHPRAAGAVRTPNCYDGPEPLFLVRYAADLRMARVWQPPSSGTHQAERVTLPHGFSVGEFDGPNRGGKTGWHRSWDQQLRKQGIQSLQPTSPCEMRSGGRESRRGSTRGNAFNAGAGSGHGILSGFAVSCAMRPRRGSSGGSSRSFTGRQDSLDRRGAKVLTVPAATGRIR